MCGLYIGTSCILKYSKITYGTNLGKNRDKKQKDLTAGMCKGREHPSIASEIKSGEGAIFSTSLREV